MKKLILLIVLLNTGLLFSQKVENVTFSQRTDGSLLVDITYDLTASEAVTITVEASRDNGVTWVVPITSLNLTGAVGEGIEENVGEEKGKSIVWDFYADTGDPGESGDEYVVKVTAAIRGTVTFQEVTYTTIKIGSQWWLAENYKATKYENGDDIPEVSDNTAWAGLSTGAYCTNNGHYYYNWWALANIATPEGWRVPSDADLTALTDYLIANGYNWDGLTTGNLIGKAMASSGGGWTSSSTAGQVGNDQSSNNTSGFSALPAGYRDLNGSFTALGGNAVFWSATAGSATDAWSRLLGYSSSGVDRYNASKPYGFSVRLVRD